MFPVFALPLFLLDRYLMLSYLISFIRFLILIHIILFSCKPMSFLHLLCPFDLHFVIKQVHRVTFTTTGGPSRSWQVQMLEQRPWNRVRLKLLEFLGRVSGQCVTL